MKGPFRLSLNCPGNAGDIGDTPTNDRRGPSPPEEVQPGTLGTGWNRSHHGTPVPIAQVRFGDYTQAIKYQALPNVPNVPGGRRTGSDQ
jgi:hypothetical protein